MDSLTNSYSIYFPSGLPSVSFPLPHTPFPPFFSVFSLLPLSFHLAPASPATLSHLLSSYVLFFPRPLLLSTHPYKAAHWFSLILSLYPVFFFFSHLIQCGLAHREVFDLQSIFVGLQLVEDVSNPSRSVWYMVLHHGRVLVLCIQTECKTGPLKGGKRVNLRVKQNRVNINIALIPRIFRGHTCIFCWSTQ